MRNGITAVHLLVALGVGALPSTAFAYCAGWDKTRPNYDPQYYSVHEEFVRSQWVIKAKVIKEIWIGEDGHEKKLRPPFQNGFPRPWGFDPYIGAFYDLRVVRSFKGKPPAVVRVFSENSTARFWLKEGEEILAFVSTEKFDPPIGKQLTLDTCGNLRPFPQADSIMAALLKSAKARK